MKSFDCYVSTRGTSCDGVLEGAAQALAQMFPLQGVADTVLGSGQPMVEQPIQQQQARIAEGTLTEAHPKVGDPLPIAQSQSTWA